MPGEHTGQAQTGALGEHVRPATAEGHSGRAGSGDHRDRRTGQYQEPPAIWADCARLGSRGAVDRADQQPQHEYSGGGSEERRQCPRRAGVGARDGGQRSHQTQHRDHDGTRGTSRALHEAGDGAHDDQDHNEADQKRGFVGRAEGVNGRRTYRGGCAVDH